MKSQIVDTKATVTEEQILIAKPNKEYQLDYNSIKGISKWLDSIRIILKDGSNIRISKAKLNNLGIERLFVVGNGIGDGIKILPFYMATSIRNSLLSLFFLFTIVFALFSISGNKHHLYPYLPLQSIKVITLDGTIRGKPKLPKDYYMGPHLMHKTDKKHSRTSGNFYLIEYPGREFSLPSAHHLRNKTLNFEKTKKFTVDTSVKIKIRSRDLKKLTRKDNGYWSDYLPQGSISVYYLEVDDVVLIEIEKIVDVEIKD